MILEYLRKQHEMKLEIRRMEYVRMSGDRVDNVIKHLDSLTGRSLTEEERSQLSGFIEEYKGALKGITLDPVETSQVHRRIIRLENFGGIR